MQGCKNKERNDDMLDNSVQSPAVIMTPAEYTSLYVTEIVQQNKYINCLYKRNILVSVCCTRLK